MRLTPRAELLELLSERGMARGHAPRSKLAALGGTARHGLGCVVAETRESFVDTCLGASALSGSLRAPLDSLLVDLIALVVMTLLVALFIRTARTITPLGGGIALALFTAYGVMTVLRG